MAATTGVTFTLDSAQKIATVVKKVLGQPQNLVGQQSNPQPIGTSFWAMITGSSSIDGKLFDFVACMPNAETMADTSINTELLATRLWQFRDPWTAGWSCCREANDNIGIPPGTVAQLTLVGYVPANVVDGYQLNGVATIQGGQPLTAPDGKVPFYTFSYNMVQQTNIIALHDHRDNVTGGGFAFSVYHPGTALPQQNWSQ